MARAIQLAAVILPACLLASACDEPVIDALVDELAFDVPCAAAERGSCTWVGDTCDFSMVNRDFCGATSAPPSCFSGDEELVASLAVTIPPILSQGLDVQCTILDGINPLNPMDATVCVYPLADDTCRGSWAYRSDPAEGLSVRFQSSGGARIVVVDIDENECNSLSISCTAF